jgi:hypothetical protein
LRSGTPFLKSWGSWQTMHLLISPMSRKLNNDTRQWHETREISRSIEGIRFTSPNRRSELTFSEASDFVSQFRRDPIGG